MSQRITSGMMVSNFNRNLGAANERMYKFQNQLATNKRMVRLSDDPVGVVKSLNARSKLYDIEQYQKNLESAQAWLTQTESSLGELNNIIKRGYELAVYASNDVLTNDDRDAIAREIGQLRDQILTVSNTTIGDKYIFGGYNFTSAPFVADMEAGEIYHNGEDMVGGDPDADFPLYEINTGVDFEVGISGREFLGSGEGNVFHIFHQMFQTLSTTSEMNEEGLEILHENIKPFIGQMTTAQNMVLTQLAEVGGRSARIEMMTDRYATSQLNYTQMKSDVEDLDAAEAITWFSMAEAVYRSALGIGGRILPPSLQDFMR